MQARPRIYLDHHATTPCDPRVVDEMLPTFSAVFGNAASRQHSFGADAGALVQTARARVARLLGCRSDEIIFTSGATESDNLAIKGVAFHRSARGKHVITSSVEHRAVLDSCQALERRGYRVTYLPVDGDGRVRLRDLENALTPNTTLVSLMYANNEIGTLNPVREIGALCREHGVYFHCDAVQALPYLDCNVEDLKIDLCSISAHKMYGPKGSGALYVRRRNPRVRLQPLIDGGGHEKGLRSGTLNVAGAVGLGKACELVAEERDEDARRVGDLRDALLDSIRTALPDTVVHGSMEWRLPNNLNLSFRGVKSQSLLESIEDVALSSGAACSSASQDGSYVLRALGAARELEDGSIRIGLGRFTSREEIDRAAEEIVSAVRRARAKPSPGGRDEEHGEECGAR